VEGQQEANRLARQQYEDDQVRRRNIAQLLMPMYQQMMGSLGAGSTTGVIAQPPSSFLAGSGPASMSDYLDLTTMGPGNRSMMPGTMRPGTAMGDYLESTGAFVGRQELPDISAGERFGMAGTMPRRQRPSMARRSPGGFMILDDTSRGY